MSVTFECLREFLSDKFLENDVEFAATSILSNDFFFFLSMAHRNKIFKEIIMKVVVNQSNCYNNLVTHKITFEFSIFFLSVLTKFISIF